MKEILAKLKKRQRKLKKRLASVTGSGRKRLEKKIAVVKAQRKKGIAHVKKLRGEARN